MLADGRLDLCPSSSIEYAKHPEKYLILRDLSISSVGRVKSVFLFSRRPIENLNGQTVGLTRESATSVNLLKIILARFYNFRNQFTELKDANIKDLDDLPAVLLIGDSALKTALRREEGVYSYDLGELWNRFTGLPFVFALWIVRDETATDNRDAVTLLHGQLSEAKQRAYDSYAVIAEEFGKEWIGKNELVDYWKTISYDLTPCHMEGLKLYYRFSAELHLTSGEPLIRMFP